MPGKDQLYRYCRLLMHGYTPQEARQIIDNAIKRTIEKGVVTWEQKNS